MSENEASAAPEGPTVFINGWRLGLNKTGVGTLLHESGLPLVEAFRLSNKIVDSFRRDPDDPERFDVGEPVRIQVPNGMIGRDDLIAKLRDLGLLIE